MIESFTTDSVSFGRQMCLKIDAQTRKSKWTDKERTCNLLNEHNNWIMCGFFVWKMKMHSISQWSTVLMLRLLHVSIHRPYAISMIWKHGLSHMVVFISCLTCSAIEFDKKLAITAIRTNVSISKAIKTSIWSRNFWPSTMFSLVG